MKLDYLIEVLKKKRSGVGGDIDVMLYNPKSDEYKNIFVGVRPTIVRDNKVVSTALTNSDAKLMLSLEPE